jgi:hypothetical protein
MRTLRTSVFWWYCLAVFACASYPALAQETHSIRETNNPPKIVERSFAIRSTVDSATEIAPEFGPPLRCDRDGNLYLHAEVFGVSGFRKINPKGERLATFDPKVDSHLKQLDLVPTFAIGRGKLYALVYPHERTKYLIEYDLDGKYRSTITLDSGYFWFPSAFAVFQSGEMLIAGRRYARGQDNQLTKVPFTGIFKPDGTLLKELQLPDDDELQKRAESGERRTTVPNDPGSNLAIDFTQMDSGDDGNIYMMRWTNPAIIYVMAPTGEIIRRFNVDPGDADLDPISMQVSENRLAVFFLQPQTGFRVLKIVNLEGEDVVKYSQSAKDAVGPVGAAFACYSANPERFTFLGVTKDRKLRLIFADGR